jgi:hypothetical protein
VALHRERDGAAARGALEVRDARGGEAPGARSGRARACARVGPLDGLPSASVLALASRVLEVLAAYAPDPSNVPGAVQEDGPNGQALPYWLSIWARWSRPE